MTPPLTLKGYVVNDHFLEQLRNRAIPLDWVWAALCEGDPSPKLYQGKPQTHYHLEVPLGPYDPKRARLVLVTTADRQLKTAWISHPKAAANNNIEQDQGGDGGTPNRPLCAERRR